MKEADYGFLLKLLIKNRAGSAAESLSRRVNREKGAVKSWLNRL
jgi:predicted transcriptional regulator